MKAFIMIIAALALGACGNTISGIGADISDAGAKVTKWQKGDKPVAVTEPTSRKD